MRSVQTLPTPPGGLPLLGHILQLDIEQLHRTVEAWADAYGTYRLGLGRRQAIVTGDPAMVNEVLRRRPQVFRRQRHLAETIEELTIHGVFTAEGDAWARQRKVAMRALGQHTLEGFADVIRRVTGDLHARWTTTNGRPTDVLTDCTCFTVDVLTELAFGEPAGSLRSERSRLLDHIDPIFPVLGRRLFAVVPYWRWVRLRADRELDDHITAIRSYLTDVIAKAREGMTSGQASTFIEAMVDERASFTDEELIGNAITMLFAGEDTTASTLAWALHLLTDAPEILAAIAAEADERFGDDRWAPSLADSRIPLVDAVIHEALRLKPVGPMLYMEAVEPTTLGDLEVPTGTTVIVLTRHAALDAERFPEPHAFDPGHWSDPARVARLQREGVFVPFGSGPRICPGRALALTELRLALTMVARSFTLQRVGAAEAVDEINGFTMAPRNLSLRFLTR